MNRYHKAFPYTQRLMAPKVWWLVLVWVCDIKTSADCDLRNWWVSSNNTWV